MSLSYSLKHITYAKTIETLKQQLADRNDFKNSMVSAPVASSITCVPTPPPPPPPLPSPLVTQLNSNSKTENKPLVPLPPPPPFLTPVPPKMSNGLSLVNPPPLPCATMSAPGWSLQKPSNFFVLF